MKQTINVGNEKMKVNVHPIAPIVLNFSKNGKYNKDQSKMRFVGLNYIDWMLENLNRFATYGVSWYVASDSEYIETLSNWSNLEDVRYDFIMCMSRRHDPFFVHMMDAFEMIIAQNAS